VPILTIRRCLFRPAQVGSENWIKAILFANRYQLLLVGFSKSSTCLRQHLFRPFPRFRDSSRQPVLRLSSFIKNNSVDTDRNVAFPSNENVSSLRLVSREPLVPVLTSCSLDNSSFGHHTSEARGRSLPDAVNRGGWLPATWTLLRFWLAHESLPFSRSVVIGTLSASDGRNPTLQQ
jgi:hypothetical protein